MAEAPEVSVRLSLYIDGPKMILVPEAIMNSSSFSFFSSMLDLAGRFASVAFTTPLAPLLAATAGDMHVVFIHGDGSHNFERLAVKVITHNGKHTFS